MYIRNGSSAEKRQWMALNSVQKHLRNDIFAFQTRHQTIQCCLHSSMSTPPKCRINYACFNCILSFWCPQKLFPFSFLLLLFDAIFCPLVQIYSRETNGTFSSCFFLFSSFSIYCVSFYRREITMIKTRLWQIFVSPEKWFFTQEKWRTIVLIFLFEDKLLCHKIKFHVFFVHLFFSFFRFLRRFQKVIHHETFTECSRWQRDDNKNSRR